MGTFRILFLTSSLSSLSTDIRLVSASLLVGTDLAVGVSSVSVIITAFKIFYNFKILFYLFESSRPPTHMDPDPLHDLKEIMISKPW